ncbi:MAG: M15 family metallopeptidase [Oligoflexia bacterium]|nr:M15 family metallopeptidase [Oligoflexia bacterium]
MSIAKISLEKCLLDSSFCDCSEYPSLAIDLRYGTENNLLKKNVYGGFQRVILHKLAAEKLLTACLYLEKKYSDYSFLVFDALRPQSAQEAFWKEVEGTDMQKYFANPLKGSIHSYGFAIDIGLCTKKDLKEVDFGTEFDALVPESEPQLEEHFLKKGILTTEQINNRRILREAMITGGFLPIPHEWWHFDALPPAEVRNRFQRVP